MSLNRLIYYSALIGAWSALVAWAVAEWLVRPEAWLGKGNLSDAARFAMIGAAIGGGLNLVAGMVNAQWRQQLKRLGPGLLIGGVGGAVGGLIGSLVYTHLGLPRAIGWLVMGLTIGAVDGVSERSLKKIRNGLIGGAVGGLLGGLLFDPLSASQKAVAGRALAFVVLGLSIGALIGLVQVILKEAWLTVLDGYRPGRQLILTREVTTLGRAENATLPFFGTTAREVEKEHARVVRQPNGQFVLEDNNTKGGTKVNGEPIQGAHVLRDGDRVRLGGNIVRFSERARPSAPAAPPVARPAPPAAAPAPKPPAVPPPAAVPVSKPAPPAAVPAPKVAAPEGPRSPDQCPKCGSKVPGPPGRRRCLRDGTVF